MTRTVNQRPSRAGTCFSTDSSVFKTRCTFLGQFRIVQSRDDVGDGAPRVTRNELDDVARLRREAPYAERGVEEQDCDVGAVEQVLHVVAGPR